MEAKTPLSAAERAANLGLGTPKPWCGIGVRASHWQLLKDVTRLVLPELQPARRLEFIARAFGYRTAAALQADISEATEDDLILRPKRGGLDEFRLQSLFEDAAEDAWLSDKLRMVNAGSLVLAGIFLAHQTGEAPESLDDIEAFEEAIPFEEKAPGRTRTSLCDIGPVVLEAFLPDLRESKIGRMSHLQHGDLLEKQFLAKDDAWAEVLCPSTNAQDMVQARALASGGPFLEQPILSAREISLTLLSHWDDGRPTGIMTARIKLGGRDLSEAGEDGEGFRWYDETLFQEGKDTAFKMGHWDITVLVEGFRATSPETENAALDELSYGLRTVLQDVFEVVSDNANRSGVCVRTRVTPLQGDGIDPGIFGDMVECIENAIQDFEADYESLDDIPEDHAFTFCAPGQDRAPTIAPSL